ncbi:GH3 auxin-responsive promoter family protein, partial [Escherichia coli]|uniref:GH3 auxin-responsive promoter family protein n=1 Tax=Escherichia coli TaxID=562 RepID=UPI0021F39470
FEQAPENLASFTAALDARLREINSDYDAKRKSDMLLKQLVLHSVPKGTFYTFMKDRGRLGGQAKVPRLSEDRKYIIALLRIVEGVD